MGALIDFIAPAGGLFFCLMLLGMIFLSAAWYIHNMAPVIVAQFTSRDANVPIYWADNTVTVGARDGADAVFPLEAGPKSDDRPDDRPGSRPGNRPIQGRLIFSRARLMADDPDNPPWLFESASGGAKPLRSGDEVDLFDSGRTYRFESFISRENMKQKRFPPRFSWILALCAMAFLVELAMSFHAGARASALMTADPAGLQRQIIRIAETLASNPDSAQTLFGWAVCLSGLFLTLIHFGMFWFTALKQPRRLTPEMVLAFFLSFLGYILFPDLMTFCVVLIGWSLWFGFSPWIHKNLSKIRSGESARRPFSLSPRWILTIALTALLLVGVLYAALRGTLTISLPVVGQVGDWGFVILLLLTLTDMRDASRIRNLWIPFAFIAAYFLIFFAAGETGGPVVLAIIFLFYVVMRLAALARFPVPALIAAGFVLVFLLAFAFGNFFTYAAPNHKIAKRIVQWAENYQKEDSSEPLQVQRARTLAAAGGWKGFGLYKGLYRIKGEEASTDFVAAVLFEEMGMRNGSLIILLLLLVAYGCYVQGVRNSKMHYAILCYSIAGFIAVRTLVGLASSTGVRLELGWLRLGVPVVGLPLPFLSRGGASEVILFLCLSVMEAAKMMEVSFRQKVMEEEEM